MIALGNDVVDLTEAPRNGENYYHRLIQVAFSSQEMDQLSSRFSLEIKCAILWSAKEAAYKSLKKCGNTMEFSPKEMSVLVPNQDGLELQGIVQTKEHKFVLSTSISEGWVHSLTYLMSADVPTFQVIACEKDPVSQSRIVREQALHHFKSADAIEKNQQGIPQFFRQGVLVPNELSLSHHHQVAAFAFQS